MNTFQAKEIPLVEFLSFLSLHPTKIRWHDYWYVSPLRPPEKTPSFKVDAQKNIWYDHGIWAGGTIIDIVRLLYSTDDIARVLVIIHDVVGTVAENRVIKTNSPVQDTKKIQNILHIGAIQDKRLEQYLCDRCIPIDLARIYLKEIWYRVDTKNFSSLAFKNDAGGFEVRNSAFKGTLWKKDISFFGKPWRSDGAVFEGFFDFLSILAYYKKEEIWGNALVLNSVSMIDRWIKKIEKENITSVSVLFDHDDAGRNAHDVIKLSGSCDVQDASDLYRGHKDVNAFLVAKNTSIYK